MWSWCKEMASQADLQELLQTAVVTVAFGLMLSKLISMITNIWSSIQSGEMRIERATEEASDTEIPSQGEQKQGVESRESSSSADEENDVHSLDSDGDRGDVSGWSEGRAADYSEVSEGGGMEETAGAGPPIVNIKRNEQESCVAQQSLAPELVSEGGYEPSTSSCSEAEETRANRGGGSLKGPVPAVVEEDSDWEGVESTELEEAFGRASSYVATLAAGGLKVSNETQLQLYGLYKVATEGTCHAPQPSALKMTARAKWNAWQKLGSITQEEAMERYIKLVTEISPEWAQAVGKSSKGGEGSSGINPKTSHVGPVFSTLSYEDKSDDGSLESLHVAAREGNESTVLELLNQEAAVDMRDSDGRTPLHWASDRGHLNVVELLLSRGADVQAKDKEGQSALHYAVVCEQEQVAKLLFAKGADCEAKDDEGATPLSLCPSSWSSWMTPRAR